MADKFVQYGDKKMPLEAGMTLEQAKELMARHFPELAEPKIETKKDKDDTIYVFSKKAGTKGNCRTRSGAPLKPHRRANRRRHSLRTCVQRLQKVKPAASVPPAVVEWTRQYHAGRQLGDNAYIAAVSGSSGLSDEAARVREIGVLLRGLPTTLKPSGSVL